MISLKIQTVTSEVKMIYTYEERLTWTCGRKLTLIYKIKTKSQVTMKYFSQRVLRGTELREKQEQ